jgi:two-component sensor histidine kinase
MKASKASILEKLIIAAVFGAAFYSILYHPTLPVFINEFNTVDGSIYVSRFVDLLIALVIFMSAAFFLVPKYLEKRSYVLFVVLSFCGIAALSMIHHQLNGIVLRLFNLPTGPHEISDKMITYIRGITFDFPIIPVNAGIYILGILYGMSRDWIQRSRRESRLVKEKMKADIELLRSQINPHFFFNALNNIYAITQRKGEEETGRAIMKLSGLMRHLIYDSDQEAVGLDRELEHVQSFIDVARLKFTPDEEVDISLEKGGDLHAVRIAPLILIPFVENAAKHGLGSRGEGYIRMKIQVEDGVMLFSVKNPILNKGAAIKKHSGIGLENVKKRLDLLYPGRNSLDITEKEGVFAVDLTIEPEKNR